MAMDKAANSLIANALIAISVNTNYLINDFPVYTHSQHNMSDRARLCITVVLISGSRVL